MNSKDLKIKERKDEEKKIIFNEFEDESKETKIIQKEKENVVFEKNIK